MEGAGTAVTTQHRVSSFDALQMQYRWVQCGWSSSTSQVGAMKYRLVSNTCYHTDSKHWTALSIGKVPAHLENIPSERNNPGKKNQYLEPAW